MCNCTPTFLDYFHELLISGMCTHINVMVLLYLYGDCAHLYFIVMTQSSVLISAEVRATWLFVACRLNGPRSEPSLKLSQMQVVFQRTIQPTLHLL